MTETAKIASQPEWRDIDSILPYPLNAKKHGPDQVRRIANSIKKFGWRGNPIIVNGDGVIIAGHGRRLAAIDLGMAKVPVLVEHMTEAQERAYRLADNRAAEGGIDQDLLKQELLELPEIADDWLSDIYDKKELNFAIEDLMGVNEAVFHQDLDTAMDDVETTTDAKIANAAEKRVGLDKAFGFKNLKGGDVIHVTHFMALITAQHDLSPEEAFLAHIKGMVEQAQ